MAKEAGPSQHQSQTADQAAEQMMKTVLNLTPFGIMHHATKHFAAAFTFAQRLTQATDLLDRARIHAEHAQSHINLFNERAKELSAMMAVAGNFAGAMVEQLRLHQQYTDITRRPSAQQATGGQQTSGTKPKP
jgi:hypothetical protein